VLTVAPEWYASAAGFALAMSATPGPNNALIAASAANFGLVRSIPHLLGVALGFPAMLLAVALGAAEVLRQWPLLSTAMQWLGAAWLLWLAWRIATTRPAGKGHPVPAVRPDRRPMSFLQAALFQWVNPKAWLIAVSAIGTYAGEEVLVRASFLGGMFAAAALLSLAAWAALGRTTAHLLPPRTLLWFHRIMAALMVLSLMPMLVG
jgi:threonine/homoserine/homoserine lactone efflux protein